MSATRDIRLWPGNHFFSPKSPLRRALHPVASVSIVKTKNPVINERYRFLKLFFHAEMINSSSWNILLSRANACGCCMPARWNAFWCRGAREGFAWRRVRRNIIMPSKYSVYANDQRSRKPLETINPDFYEFKTAWNNPIIRYKLLVVPSDRNNMLNAVIRL